MKNVTHNIDFSSYKYIHQGPVTNTLPQLASSPDGYEISNGMSVYTGNGISIALPQSMIPRLRLSSPFQLLDAFIAETTLRGVREPTVTLALTDYMTLRGLKSRDVTLKQVNADLDLLSEIRLSFTQRNGKDECSFKNIRIGQRGKCVRGYIVFVFSEEFLGLLRSYPFMPVPKQLWTIRTSANPNSYFLLRQMLVSKNMNIGKANEDIVSVKKLLCACPSIPGIETVMDSGRAVGRRIFAPFERDMDALSETLTWQYCHYGGTPLTEKERAEMNYRIFVDSVIHIDWVDYPDQTERREKLASRSKPSARKSESPE